MRPDDAGAVGRDGGDRDPAVEEVDGVGQLVRVDVRALAGQAEGVGGGVVGGGDRQAGAGAKIAVAARRLRRQGDGEGDRRGGRGGVDGLVLDGALERFGIVEAAVVGDGAVEFVADRDLVEAAVLVGVAEALRGPGARHGGAAEHVEAERGLERQAGDLPRVGVARHDEAAQIGGLVAAHEVERRAGRDSPPLGSPGTSW